jgi:hypothetical protein
MKEILLIGNGPSILSKEVGHIIDTYPLICRFNAFQINGYEKYTGMRTDVWITCLIDEVIKNECLKYKKIYFPLAQQRFLDLEKIIPNSECFPKYIYNNAASFNNEYWFYPSSGLMASLFFIEREYDVIIHGFDFFQTSRHHYCDDQQLGINHSSSMELMAFTKLINESKVRMLQ